MATDPRAEWIDLVLARALELRTAGVLSIQYDGCAATFAGLSVVATGDIDKPEPEEVVTDPLNDPATYPGGVVPGYRITKYETEE